ncbi:MAG TPA: hypothetical protein VF041_21610 [Gemmatimonadaceae bacterium]
MLQPAVSSRRIILALCVVSALACGGRTTAPTTGVTPERPESTAVANVPHWEPHRTPGTWRYLASSSTVVSLESDTLAKQLPVQSSAIYRITATGTTPPFAIQGTVDSVTVITSGKPSSPGAAKHPYATFTSTLSPEGSIGTIEGSEPPRCPKGVDPLVAGVRTLFIAMPPTIARGATWQDTVTAVTCRGDVPIVATTAYRYTLVGDTVWQGKPALHITRGSEMTVGNDSTIAGQPTFEISGTGTGTADLLVDPATGTLLQQAGRSTARLVIGTARSRVPFRQEVTDTVQIRP